VVSKKRQRPEKLRILLDQGFPNPPGFRLDQVDKNLEAHHLSAWRPDLARQRTPDWVLYCEAALAGYNALVTRDFSQSGQAEEMVCLSRLTDFHVVSWKERMDDPIVEWGQLLAYLPLLRRFIGAHSSQVVFLPRPRLGRDHSVHDPKEFIGDIANSVGESVTEVRRRARDIMLDWERTVGTSDGRYERLLRY
jgi:hypothetical protein